MLKPHSTICASYFGKILCKDSTSSVCRNEDQATNWASDDWRHKCTKNYEHIAFRLSSQQTQVKALANYESQNWKQWAKRSVFETPKSIWWLFGPTKPSFAPGKPSFGPSKPSFGAGKRWTTKDWCLKQSVEHPYLLHLKQQTIKYL